MNFDNFVDYNTYKNNKNESNDDDNNDNINNNDDNINDNDDNKGIFLENLKNKIQIKEDFEFKEFKEFKEIKEIKKDVNSNNIFILWKNFESLENEKNLKIDSMKITIKKLIEEGEKHQYTIDMIEEEINKYELEIENIETFYFEKTFKIRKNITNLLKS